MTNKSLSFDQNEEMWKIKERLTILFIVYDFDRQEASMKKFTQRLTKNLDCHLYFI